MSNSKRPIQLQKVLIPAGSVSRLARPPAVSFGDWYIVVHCKGCKKPIYLLEDKWNGLDPHRFVGEGKISTPCPRCHTDTKYGTDEITSIQATEDIAPVTPPRVDASNMPRQPLKTKYPHANPTFGPGFLEDRPKAASIVARCIALWAEVETQLAHLLATMLRANEEPAIALFLALRNSRAQYDVLNAVAEVTLNEADKKLFDALMSYRSSVEKERTALAHGCFGGLNEIEDGVVWIESLHRTQHTMRVSANGVTDEAMDWLRSKTYVYELGDLETIAQDTEDLYTQLGFFRGYLWSYQESAPDGPAWRENRYKELCAAPRVAQALQQLRKNSTTVKGT